MILALQVLDLVLRTRSPHYLACLTPDLFRYPVFRSPDMFIVEVNNQSIMSKSLRLLSSRADLDSKDPNAIILEFHLRFALFHSSSPLISSCLISTECDLSLKF